MRTFCIAAMATTALASVDFFPTAGSAPKCRIDALGRTIVQYADNVHVSFKCEPTGAGTCACTNKHPTHHAGKCHEITHQDGTNLKLSGACGAVVAPVVRTTVQLSLATETVASFTADKQDAFRRGFAIALDVPVKSVKLSVAAAGRRLSESASGIVLTVTVMSSVGEAALEVQKDLAAPAFSDALVAAVVEEDATVAISVAAVTVDAVTQKQEMDNAPTASPTAAPTAAPTKATPLELLSANQKGTWSATGANTFVLGDAAHHRHAYRKTFIGSNSGGGLCAAPGSSHFEADVTMLSSTNSQVQSKGNSAAISMRADAAKGSLGYQCTISTEHGDNGIKLTRDGKTLACPRIDQSAGVMNRYSTGYDKNVPGPYTYAELCQIQERKKDASLFSKDQQYTLRMDLVEDADLNTVKVSCSVDGVTKLFFTDPCPLEGGAFALDAKYQTKFQVTDYTKQTCDTVPQAMPLVPSLADGLTLVGMGRTSEYWVSKNLAASNTVAHRYAGGCNNGAYPYGASNHPGGAGLNREGGGRSNAALNVAALSSGSCTKDGFIEADVSVRGDFLGISNGYRKVSADDTHIDENQRLGVVGIAMRVDSTDNGQAASSRNVAYDSFGYMCQMTAKNGQVSLYRGRNGAQHNQNLVGSYYLSGRYRCKACTCKTTPDDASCTQFGFASGGWNPSAKHTLRLEVANDADGHPNVKCILDGVTIVEAVDKKQGRHNRYPGNQKVGPSAGTNSCGDFGLVTTDSDVVEYIIKDYTGKK